MNERDGYIPGVPCWVDTSQPDPHAAAAFYRDLFGWDIDDAMGDDELDHYFIGRIRGGDVAAVSSLPHGAAPTATWNTYIWVAGADEAVAAVRLAGGQVLAEPFDVDDAGRMAVVSDPEGAAFCLWEAGRHRGAKIVNEHGSLNFNTLATRDPDGAAAFYGAVFGWELLHLPSGSMWALPGYGDHLEASNPGLRAQMEAMGAPDGFIDVVAALGEIPRGDGDTPAHWNVTFGVDDVDATVIAAQKLGGVIVSGPVNAPWTRMAVIEDPQGARFVASQFVPENRDLQP